VRSIRPERLYFGWLVLTGDYTNYYFPAPGRQGRVVGVIAMFTPTNWIISGLPTIRQLAYCGFRFRGLPIASRKMALLFFACGEKKLTTSSSKKVSPVAPRCWAYAAR
jgi:hypothetical protein